MAFPFLIEILNIFYTVSWQIAYFKTFGLGNTIITPKNSQAKNIKIDKPEFFKAKIKDTLIFIKGANNEIAKFYLYNQTKCSVILCPKYDRLFLSPAKFYLIFIG